jgi:hypothetical protein
MRAHSYQNYRAIPILVSPSIARRLHYVVLKTVMMYFQFSFLAHQSTADTSGATPQFLVTVDIGSILNRFSQDMTLIESDLPFGILITVSSKTPAILLKL